MKNIQNIIFDLGGVLLNIDYHKTIQAFENLGIKDFEKQFSQVNAAPLFEDLELGKITPEAFFDGVRALAKLSLSNQEIITAWNAMLLDFPMENFTLLQSLKTSYKLFLYSNTNSIHYDAFQQIFQKTTGHPLLDECFQKAYYSHLMGKRKPYKEGFQTILQENNLVPEQTLFIDDTLPNIKTAKSLGLKSILISQKLKITTINWHENIQYLENIA